MTLSAAEVRRLRAAVGEPEATFWFECGRCTKPFQAHQVLDVCWACRAAAEKYGLSSGIGAASGT